MSTQHIWKPFAIIAFCILAGCATTNAYQEAERLEKSGRYGDAGDVWLRKAKSNLNSKEDFLRFPAYDFERAAENFDRDPSRSNDALQARKTAADLYLKAAEFHAAQGKFSSASTQSRNAAKLFKHYDPKKKDLGDISAAENAYLQSNRYAEAAIQGREQFVDVSMIAWNYLYGLSSLFKGHDAAKAKRYAEEIIRLAPRSPPPLGDIGNHYLITGAASVLEHEGDLNGALRAYELGLEYTDVTRNTASFDQAIVVAEKVGRADLAKRWRQELQAIEKLEGKTRPGQPWFFVSGKSPEEIEREAERRRAQSDTYKTMGLHRLAGLRQVMATDLLAQGRIARQKAAKTARDDAARAEQEHREAIEEKARREKSNRDFAIAVGTATAMIKSAQGPGASSPSYARSGQSQPQKSTENQNHNYQKQYASTNSVVSDSSQSQMNVGSAKEVLSNREVKKDSRGSSANSKYASQDATHCVEIVPKGFKGCTYKRCLHNTCGLEKISVWARGGGSGGDGLFFLSPGQNSPVNSIFDDGSPVRYQACSWDRKAGSGGPYRNPCRY